MFVSGQQPVRNRGRLITNQPITREIDNWILIKITRGAESISSKLCEGNAVYWPCHVSLVNAATVMRKSLRHRWHDWHLQLTKPRPSDLEVLGARAVALTDPVLFFVYKILLVNSMSNSWLNLILNPFVLDKHSLELWGAFSDSWNVYGGLIVRAKCQRIRIKQGIESTSCRAWVTQAAYLHLSMLCTVTVCFFRRLVEKPRGS